MVEVGVSGSQAHEAPEPEVLATMQERRLQVISVSMKLFSYLSGIPNYLTFVSRFGPQSLINPHDSLSR